MAIRRQPGEVPDGPEIFGPPDRGPIPDPFGGGKENSDPKPPGTPGVIHEGNDETPRDRGIPQPNIPYNGQPPAGAPTGAPPMPKSPTPIAGQPPNPQPGPMPMPPMPSPEGPSLAQPQRRGLFGGSGGLTGGGLGVPGSGNQGMDDPISALIQQLLMNRG